MKIMVMGAGGQGGPAASILEKDSNIEEIVLGDINVEAANKVKEKINSSKIRVEKVDASSPQDLAKAMKGMDSVIDVVLPFLASNVMKACLVTGTNYVNTAFDTPFWDEFVEGKPLSLDNDFKQAGLTALLGCGMAPGILNVMVRYYADKMDTVESIKLRLAKKNTAAAPYSAIVGKWNPGWAPKQALLDCGNKPICFRDGKYEEVSAYGEIEEWPFPEPVGKMLVSHHSHEEPYSLPRTFGKKGLKYCDFKYYVSAQPATLVAMGLTSDKEIDVKGVKVKPIDLMTELLPKPGNAFIEEDPSKLDYVDQTAYVSMIIELKGTKEGKEKTYTVHLPKLTGPGKKLYELFGTSLINVALPAVIGAKMVAEGAKKGIIFAEQLDPNRFLELFKETGHPWHWQEL